MALCVTPLGAGQQVGRSCVLLEIGGSRVILDCGVALGSNGPTHTPELGFVEADLEAGVVIDAILLSHFHLDHCGYLPYLTEVLGCRGPLIMTHPTCAIAPIILKDYLKNTYRDRQLPYTTEMIDDCFGRATCVQLGERVVIGQLSITSYYAGHVLGAVMFLVECGGQSVLYTGDFTMVPDHHLSAARLPLGLQPDVMITETTCCTTIRSSRRGKEHELCQKVERTLVKGGKVLVPVLMMGRCQELCMVFEQHWARTQLDFPIYIVKGMAEKATTFFKFFASWASNKVRAAERPFEFRYVRFCDVDEILQLQSPALVFAGPAMLNGGASLEILTHWAGDHRNLLVMPGYCLPGTVGNLIQSKAKRVDVGSGKMIDMRCQVEYMSHSDHTDSRGILELISQAAPRQVVLVHGAAAMMDTFRPLVQKRLRVPCHSPGCGERLALRSDLCLPVYASPAMLSGEPLPPPPVLGQGLPSMHGQVSRTVPFSGLFRKRSHDCLELYPLTPEGVRAAGLKVHRVRYSHKVSLTLSEFKKALEALEEESTKTVDKSETFAAGEKQSPAISWSPEQPNLGPQLWREGSINAFVLSLGAGKLPVTCRLEPGSGERLEITLEWCRGDDKGPGLCNFLQALRARH